MKALLARDDGSGMDPFSGDDAVAPGANMFFNNTDIFEVCCDPDNTATVQVLFKDGQICSAHPNPDNLCDGGDDNTGSFMSGNALYKFEFNCNPNP